MRALVLEKKSELALREIDLPQAVGPGEVRIAIDTVGVCGSDVHYYTHGRIGPFVVQAPMGAPSAKMVMAMGRRTAGKLSAMIELAGGVPPASPTPTVIRAATSWG